MEKEKKSNPLVWILVIIILVGALACGYFFIYQKGEGNDKEEAMATAAKDYFNSYMSAGTGANAYKVTLGMLKNAEKNYDLSKLESCDENGTYAMVSFDYNTGEASSAEVILDCKKK